MKHLPSLFSLAVVLSFSIGFVAHAQIPGYALVAVRGENDAATSSARDARASTSTKESDFGEQIRIIAQEQKDSVATTTGAIQKIASRSGLKTLFFGSDYENLGILRSGMVKTQNDLDRLQAILASTTDTTAHATLAAQIQVLETDKASIQSFVGAHENVFSLFGWFAKLFAKADAGN